jgi:hypothetical protein
VGPRAGLDTEDRGKILCPCRGSNPDRPVVQPVVRHYTAWTNPAPRCLYKDILILNEIWVQDFFIFLYALCLVEIICITYFLAPVLAPNYKQHILSPAAVRNVRHSLAKLYVKSVYLNVFGWRRAWSLWNILMGGAEGTPDVDTNINPLKPTLVIIIFKEFSPYLKENTTLHHYRDQLVNTV